MLEGRCPGRIVRISRSDLGCPAGGWGKRQRNPTAIFESAKSSPSRRSTTEQFLPYWGLVGTSMEIKRPVRCHPPVAHTGASTRPRSRPQFTTTPVRILARLLVAGCGCPNTRSPIARFVGVPLWFHCAARRWVSLAQFVDVPLRAEQPDRTASGSGSIRPSQRGNVLGPQG